MLLLLPLLFAGCSCQPEPVAQDAPAQASPTAAALPAAAPDAAAGESLGAVAVPELSAVAPGATDEVATVHEYIYSLLGKDRSASDAYWTGGSAGTRPDDQLLRAIPELRNLRVKTSAPIARDDKEPSHLLEVPVNIRAMTGEGTLTFTGWYRLQPRPDASGWEIHSASLQPVMR
jgi:hypothetical protein